MILEFNVMYNTCNVFIQIFVFIQFISLFISFLKNIILFENKIKKFLLFLFNSANYIFIISNYCLKLIILIKILAFF